MYQHIEAPVPSLVERLRDKFGRRAVGLILTIMLEAILALLVLSISQPILRDSKEEVTVATFDTRAVPETEPPAREKDDAKANQQPQQQEQPQAEPQPQLPPVRPRPQTPLTQTPLIRISPNRMADTNIANPPSNPSVPAVPNRGIMGPTGGAASTGDSERVGTAPNGQPMYAAAWYREPTPQEMRGYLSTAEGPAWALITCRTVPDYRVEDCQPIEEYPRGSRMLRAVLAATWQFRVRPPWVGGQAQVGDWVRIRIEYGLHER